MPTYPIFNNTKNESLVFYSCPKNANTSAKLFFAKHLGIDKNFYFIQDDIPKYKTEESHKKMQEIKADNDKKNLVNIWPNYQKFSKVDSTYKCCIVRDPVERFLSAYKNRILFHKDKDFFNLSVNSIIKKLLDNNFDNKHFLPQSYFLGLDLKYYDFVIDIKNISKFVIYVNNFFGKDIEFVKLQTGGNNKKIILNDQQINAVKLIYKADFDMISKLN